MITKRDMGTILLYSNTNNIKLFSGGTYTSSLMVLVSFRIRLITTRPTRIANIIGTITFTYFSIRLVLCLGFLIFYCIFVSIPVYMVKPKIHLVPLITAPRRMSESRVISSFLGIPLSCILPLKLFRFPLGKSTKTLPLSLTIWSLAASSY